MPGAFFFPLFLVPTFSLFSFRSSRSRSHSLTHSLPLSLPTKQQERLPAAVDGGEPIPEGLMWLLLTGDVSFFFSFVLQLFVLKKPSPFSKPRPRLSKKLEKFLSDPDQGPGHGPLGRARVPRRPPAAGRGRGGRPAAGIDAPDDAARRRHARDAVRVQVRQGVRRRPAQVAVLGARAGGLAGPDREAAGAGREDLQEDLPRREVYRGKGKFFF